MKLTQIATKTIDKDALKKTEDQIQCGEGEVQDQKSLDEILIPAK